MDEAGKKCLDLIWRCSDNIVQVEANNDIVTCASNFYRDKMRPPSMLYVRSCLGSSSCIWYSAARMSCLLYQWTDKLAVKCNNYRCLSIEQTLGAHSCHKCKVWNVKIPAMVRLATVSWRLITRKEGLALRRLVTKLQPQSGILTPISSGAP